MGMEELRARFFESLDREAGSGTAAARAVGVNRNTAYGWMRRAGLRERGKAGPAKHTERETGVTTVIATSSAPPLAWSRPNCTRAI